MYGSDSSAMAALNKYVSAVLQAANLLPSNGDAGAIADRVVAIETVLARATPDATTLRNPQTSYFPVHLNELDAQ